MTRFTKSARHRCTPGPSRPIVARGLIGGGSGVSQTFLERCRIAVERRRQYRSAVVTAEAMIWHHGYKGLDAALKAIEAEPEDFRERVRADLVARLAADRYQRFKQADVFERALLLEHWSRRRGQMIRA